MNRPYTSRRLPHAFTGFPKSLHALAVPRFRAKVVAHTDADGLTCLLDRYFRDTSEKRIRIKDLWAHELTHPHVAVRRRAAIARDYLQVIAPVDSFCILESFKPTWDRWEGVITLPDLRDLRAVMIEAGHGFGSKAELDADVQRLIAEGQ